MLPLKCCEKSRKIVAILAIALLSVAWMPLSHTYGTLVYWQNFDGGDGIADVGVGDLGINNNAGALPGATFFSSSGGVFGGSYDASSNVTGNNSANSNGSASTNVLGGSPLSALPNQTGSGTGSMNQLTISFWLKTQTISPDSNRIGRILILGPSGASDTTNANTIAFAQLATNAVSGPSKINPYFGSADITAGQGIGADNPVDTWTFFAMSYDGTSSNGNNSTIQQAATGSSINGQFYRGTDSASVARTDLPIVTTIGAPSSASRGAINFGSSAVLFLANRSNLTRALDGWIDDVRIYDSVLTAEQIEAVRVEGIAVPEPASVFLLGIGGSILLARRRLGRRQAGR